MLLRIIPMALSPFFPIIAILGYILGSSRAVNKILTPALYYAEKDHDYNSFLKIIINKSMKIAEGDIDFKDRFMRSFVVSDNIINAIKPTVLDEFTKMLIDKMKSEDKDTVVPINYIENELKTYLNIEFNIDPEIPLKNKN